MSAIPFKANIRDRDPRVRSPKADIVCRRLSHSKYIFVVCGPDNSNDHEDNYRGNYYWAEYLGRQRLRIVPVQP